MKSVLNPPGGWAQDEGQDFLSNNKLDCVDIVGLHGASGGGCASLFLAHGGRLAVWPDNWGDAAKSPAFQQAYIRSHLADVAANIKKPFILEEVRWAWQLCSFETLTLLHSLERSPRTRPRISATATTPLPFRWLSRMPRRTVRSRGTFLCCLSVAASHDTFPQHTLLALV
jgi:hypothetical protein